MLIFRAFFNRCNVVDLQKKERFVLKICTFCFRDYILY